MNRRLFLLLVSLLLVSGGCSRETPEAALELASETLQDALEVRSTDQAMSLLHEKFTTQAAPENGRDWARRTMTVAFMRYKAIRLIARNVENRINPQFPDHATTRCEVLMVGAEGVISGSARSYRVELEWVREGRDWKLLRLTWQ